MDARVVVAMRYWHPFTSEAIAELEEHAPGDIVLLPLYPQWSNTTTASSLHEWERRYTRNGNGARVHVIRDYHDDPGFVCAVVAGINRALRGFGDPAGLDFVFSAHGVPLSVVRAGDPYERHVERSVDLVWQRGGWPGRRHLCYQSKVGTAKWLGPSMSETIDRLASEGRERVLVIPISFVSDHVETLHEIDIEHREQAERLGIREFRLMPGLNDAPGIHRRDGEPRTREPCWLPGFLSAFSGRRHLRRLRARAGRRRRGAAWDTAFPSRGSSPRRSGSGAPSGTASGTSKRIFMDAWAARRAGPRSAFSGGFISKSDCSGSTTSYGVKSGFR